jgi:hypothetical protein
VSTGLAALQFLQLFRSGGQDARRTAGETPALPGLFAGSFCDLIYISNFYSIAYI